MTFHPTFQSYSITKLLLPSAYRRHFISWDALPCFKVITAQELGHDWEMTARRIALWMHLHRGPYMHQCAEAGHWPFYSSRTIQPGTQLALPTVPKQPAMGWVIWPAPEGSSDPGNAALRQTNKTRIQAKNSRKGWRNSRMWPRVRDIWAICTRQPNWARAWAQVLAQHHPAARLSVQSLACTCPTATSLLSNSAWTLLSNSQGPFPIYGLDGPPCWGRRRREIMVKSDDTPAGLGIRGQFPGLFYLLV